MSGQLSTSGTEQVVARAWRAALDLDTFGPTDNFFDLGGHSVLMHVVREQLVRELGRDVALVDLFRYPTVRTVAAHLDGATPSSRRTTTAGGHDRLRARRARRDVGVAR